MAARDAMRPVQAFQQWQQRPAADEPEERDIAVDPFSLRQFSHLDMDGPLSIPSVSVADHPHASPPARRHCSSPVPVASSSSPRASIAGRLNALAEATGWDDADARAPASSHKAHSVSALPRGESSSAGGTTELADGGGFVDVLFSSSGRKAIEPQRWGSDVPLIAAVEDEDSVWEFT